MGHYINPTSESKEQWLHNFGYVFQPHGEPEVEWKSCRSRDSLPVCLVDNGAFTAAGVAFDIEEYKAFLHPDRRPRKWYVVKITDLVTVGAIPPDHKY